MDIFANYPHIDSLFVRLARYNVHIEEMYINFRSAVDGPDVFPKLSSLGNPPSRIYGDPLDHSNGWTLTALVYITWPKSRPRCPILPASWKQPAHPVDRVYKRNTGGCAAPHPFIVQAYSHKDGLEALYLLLTSLAQELEEFDARYCAAL